MGVAFLCLLFLFCLGGPNEPKVKGWPEQVVILTRVYSGLLLSYFEDCLAQRYREGLSLSSKRD